MIVYKYLEYIGIWKENKKGFMIILSSVWEGQVNMLTYICI